jgi:hypothetical protein
LTNFIVGRCIASAMASEKDSFGLRTHLTPLAPDMVIEIAG